MSNATLEISAGTLPDAGPPAEVDPLRRDRSGALTTEILENVNTR
jgi:hypothetical protein